MKIIVGLGNPGKEYELTRHNIGFYILDKFLGDVKWKSTKQNAVIYEKSYNGEKVIFVKPLTYMNNSGEAIREIIKYYKAYIDDLLVIQDDLDMDLGRIKLRGKSNSGGHNGIKSIESNLGTNDFKRLKVGISNNKNIETTDYVLGKFTKEDRKILDETYKECVQIIDEFLSMDFDLLMGRHNKKKENVKEDI